MGWRSRLRPPNWKRDHGTARGDRGSDLMDDQVQGMVEGAEGQDDADRLEASEGHAAGRSRVEIHRNLAARPGAQLVGADLQTIDRTRQLDPGVDQGLSALARGFERELFAALSHQGSGPLEHAQSLRGREPAVAVLEALRGRGERAVGRGCVRDIERGNQGSVVRRANLGSLCARDRARNQQGEVVGH